MRTTRHYGGKHIGILRFQLFERVAQADLDLLLQQQHKDKQPLMQQQLDDLNHQIALEAQHQQQQRKQAKNNPWYQSPTSNALESW